MEEEYKEKLNEYTNRNIFWTKEAISQLGYSINIFTTVGISILGYLISQRKEFPEFDFCNGTFSWQLTLYIFTIFFIVVSTSCGFIAILCRIFDFRITRHITNIRKKYLKYCKENKPPFQGSKNGLLDDKYIDVSRCKIYPVFKKYLCDKITFINEENFDNEKELNRVFRKIRIESAILGNNTWRFHKLQISTLFLSLIVYSLANVNECLSMSVFIVLVILIVITIIRTKFKKKN